MGVCRLFTSIGISFNMTITGIYKDVFIFPLCKGTDQNSNHKKKLTILLSLFEEAQFGEIT